ncbi:MAG: ribonuclease P protein component [bacterium]|nr:ribonuclease P protein component [bacterium]
MKKGVTALPRSGRRYVSLRGRNNFAAAYRGKRHAAGAVVVLISKVSQGPPRVALVAGKKVGNAVRRNRAKRRLRAAMGRLHLRDDTAYIVIARSGVVDAPFERLVAWLTEATQATEEREKR